MWVLLRPAFLRKCSFCGGCVVCFVEVLILLGIKEVWWRLSGWTEVRKRGRELSRGG